MAEPPYIRETAVRREQPARATSKCCAYNQTRQRFLSADVEAGDFPASSLDACLATLTPGTAAAFWIIPFRDISPTSVRAPLDLIYLDRNCVVLDTVESFPFSTVPDSSAVAASVLALPGNAIASAGTQPGDQLFLCPPEEMKRRLRQLLTAKVEPQAEQVAISAPEPAAHGAAGRVIPFDRSRPQPTVGIPEAPAVEVLPVAEPQLPEIAPAPAPEAGPAPAPLPAEPSQQKTKAPRSWLQRMLSPDPPEPRKAPRESLEGLAAYFFTGGDAVAHAVRDISATGMYVFTEERWYPGTVVRMTLTDRRQPTVERSVTVHASVVRSGSDGVGLQFMLQGGRNSPDGMVGGATKAHIDQFLKRLRSSGS